MNLNDFLDQIAPRDQIIQELIGILNEAIDNKAYGVSFVAKNGYKAISKISGGSMLTTIVARMLFESLPIMSPYFDEWSGSLSGSTTFEDHLKANSSALADELAAKADEKRQNATNSALAKAFDTARPLVIKDVEKLVPAMGIIVDKHFKAVMA